MKAQAQSYWGASAPKISSLAALRLRRQHQVADDEVTWCSDDREILHFQRSNGWQCVVNFGAEPATLPGGQVLLTSAPHDDDRLPTDAAAWIR
jgi:alpha-glucosidase